MIHSIREHWPPSCGIVLQSDSVSRQHAEFRREADAWFVVDLGAKNHVYVNDRLVERHQLADGDVVTLGKVKLTWQQGNQI